jgi:uncharacterized membrane protein
MLSFIGRHILIGLITILPVVLTLYLLYWFVVSAETQLGNVIRLVLPEHLYWPGMGMITGLIGALLIGLLMRAYLVQRLFKFGEQIFYRMPLVKSVYRAIRDFFAYFSPAAKKEFQQVVSVKIGDRDMEVIGFVTQAVTKNLPEGFNHNDNILVYIPLSYMIGGFAVFMPRSAVTPLDMNMEEAMRFTLMAGVTGSNAFSP